MPDDILAIQQRISNLHINDPGGGEKTCCIKWRERNGTLKSSHSLQMLLFLPVPPFSLKACKREVGGEYLYSKNAYWDCEKLLPPGQIQLGHPGVFSKGYILLPDSVKVSSVI